MRIESPYTESNEPKYLHVLLCYSGSVATLKIPELVTKIIELGHIKIRLIGSGKSANHFLKRSKKYNPHYYEEFLKLGGYDLIIDEKDEWNWNQIGDPVLHIELRKWADLILIAPASADIIAKAAQGISDSLLLSVLRAWDFENHNKPCILCPAMNSLMWTHPSTQESIEKLEKWGWIVVGPATKKLACNDTGKGALEEINSLVQFVHGGLEARLELINDKDDREEVNIIDDIFIKKRQRKWVFLDQDSKESSYWVLATATALFVLTASVVMGMKVMNRTKY
jgi:phosphopantothenoylcysteine decarboxylase